MEDSSLILTNVPFNPNITISTDPTDAAQQIGSLIEHMTISRYLIVVGFSVLIYDHLLTFPEEVEFVWKRPKNLISWLFLINRYGTPPVMAIDMYDKLGFSTNLTDTFCKTWVTIEVILHMLSHASIHGLVAIRVNALWGGRPTMKWFLLAVWSVYLASMASIGLAAIVVDMGTFRPNQILHSCFGFVFDFAFWVWVPPIIFESIIFGLTVAKAITQSKGVITATPLVTVLYRDGLIYFIIITLCSVFNLVVWRWLPFTYFALAKYFSLGMVNAMGSRMVLNLRELGGVRAKAVPRTFNFINTVPGPCDPENPFDSKDPRYPEVTPAPRVHQPYGSPSSGSFSSFERPISGGEPECPRKNDDPYLYNRQAGQLRALKATRSGFDLPLPTTIAPVPPSSCGSSAQIEESIMMRVLTSQSGCSSPFPFKGSGRSRPNLAGEGEMYNLGDWSNSLPLRLDNDARSFITTDTKDDSDGSDGKAGPDRFSWGK